MPDVELENPDGIGVSQNHVGGLSQFFDSPHFVDNEIAIALRLNVLMENNLIRHPRGGWLFDDDISIIIAILPDIREERQE